ncbi:hypothetical protein [uncultured Devosia sp.]|uniref:hypothetical protein n=1 Tax=uncultured Devosia sp. TaxID=211434 RepID=UPI0035C9AD53
MIKTSIIALVTVASLAGIAAPAFAATSLLETTINDRTEWSSQDALVRLQQQGVRATAAEDWGHLVRADVTLEDGTQVTQFFDRDTLKPVSL